MLIIEDYLPNTFDITIIYRLHKLFTKVTVWKHQTMLKLNI